MSEGWGASLTGLRFQKYVQGWFGPRVPLIRRGLMANLRPDPSCPTSTKCASPCSPLHKRGAAVPSHRHIARPSAKNDDQPSIHHFLSLQKPVALTIPAITEVFQRRPRSPDHTTPEPREHQGSWGVSIRLKPVSKLRLGSDSMFLSSDVGLR